MIRGSDSDGATALDPDDLDGLIPGHIATRAELNAWEQANIGRAASWLSSRRRRRVLSVPFSRQLHRQMFGDTWTWAGDFRHSDATIGVAWSKIPTMLAELIADATYWFAHGSYGDDESAARLHHRLTLIHAFPNGNGRHARLFADAVLTARGISQFTWGGTDLQSVGDVRRQYLEGLRAADRGDLTQLLRFARS